MAGTLDSRECWIGNGLYISGTFVGERHGEGGSARLSAKPTGDLDVESRKVRKEVLEQIIKAHKVNFDSTIPNLPAATRLSNGSGRTITNNGTVSNCKPMCG